MKFHKTKLFEAYLIEPELIGDERGFFARAFCLEEFKKWNLNPHLEQANLSYNKMKGTLRGMHYQLSPFAEVKIVRCTSGAIYDVIIDLRKESPTYLQWEGFELTSENRKMLYVPQGFAHGYQTLQDNSEIFYQVSTSYSREHERGVRWNDPAFNIQWPGQINTMSPKDEKWADYTV